MKFIVDTNVLLSYPLVFEHENLVLILRVLEEIDHLKTSINSETAYNARRASRYLSEKKDEIEFIIDSRRKLTVDDEIIYWAKKKKYTVISHDINIQIKCWMQGIDCIYLNKQKEYYSGIQFLNTQFDSNFNNVDVERMISTKRPMGTFKENEFLSVKDQDTDKHYCLLRHTAGEMNLIGHKQPIVNKWMHKILPRNVEQECLFDLLFDNSVKIVLAKGKYGSGKSLCLVNFALQQLERGHIDKIVWVPNNAFSQDSREVGTLPGSLFEKELPFLGTLIDIVGERGAIDLLEEGKLEIVPISIMRGRNFNNCIILVNEAQNLTEDHIKLLIGRCADGSRIFFDGDIKQADSVVFKNKNGLALLLRLADSKVFAKIFGTVTLTKIERSFTAQASDYLDELFCN